MAKGQKRSNREPRKPKQAAPKPAATQPRSFLDVATTKGAKEPLSRKRTP
ncbi:hypothetical protein [Phenylobacterium sp.]